MKLVLVFLFFCLASGRLWAGDFPSPMLRRAMEERLKDCRDVRRYVIRGSWAFYPEVSLVRVNHPGEGSMDPYIRERNKRRQFAFALGTRPDTSFGKRGTMLYFVIGSENPKGFSTAGGGVFAPQRGARAVVDWKGAGEGTMAEITFHGDRYRLLLKKWYRLPKGE